MAFIWILVLFFVGSQQGYCDHYAGHEQEDETTTLTTDCSTESYESDFHKMDRLHKEYFSPIEADSRAKRTGYVFPQSRELINTSFTCEGKPYIPGFYADMETSCQIFHACYTGVTEHYLCPAGTAFDQKNLVCNSWEKVQCHMTPMHYDSNSLLSLADKKGVTEGSLEDKGVTEGPLADKVDTEDVMFRSMFDIGDAFDTGDSFDQDTSGDAEYTTDGESVEVSLLKIYLLAKVLEASDIIQMMDESSSASSTQESISKSGRRQGRHLKDSTSPDVIENVLKKAFEVVFPLLPVRFDVTPSDSALPRRSPSPREFFPSRHIKERLSPKELILQILRLLFSVIKQTAGIISGISRGTLVSNYFNFLLDGLMPPLM